MLQYFIIPVTAFAQNCTLFWCDQTMEGAIVDPGGDIDKILAAVDRHQVQLVKILITHGHLDHAGATKTLAQQLSIPIEGPHREDQFWIDAMEQQKLMMNFSHGESFVSDRYLVQGDKVGFGEVELDVYFCPGHTPGHIVFFEPKSRLAQVGDVLFAGSIGRTDFPRGDHATLIKSIRENLFPLGDDVRFIPGHGPMSTFGEERLSNPFVADHRYG